MENQLFWGFFTEELTLFQYYFSHSAAVQREQNRKQTFHQKHF